MTDAAVTLDDLRAICGTGLAHLHAWASYEVPPLIAMIVSIPQQAFRPERLMITPNTLDRWLIHDIQIDHRSRFRTAEPIPAGELNGAPLDLGVINPGQHVELSVEYVGDVEDGEQFIGTFIGRGSGDSRMVLPILSLPIRAARGRRVLIDLGESIYRFEERDRVDVAVAKYAVGQLIDDSGPGSPPPVMIIPNRPLMISLHAETLNDASHVLFGTDEATGLVVFDIRHRPCTFAAGCDLTGYTPSWWDEVRRSDNAHG